MRDRHGQGVGGIGLQRIAHAEQYADHVLHLRFFRATAADHRLLDRGRCVFVHGQSAAHRRANRRTTRLAELQRGIRVPGHEHALDCGFLRAILINDCRQPFVDARQALRKIILAANMQRGVQHTAQFAVGIRFDHAHTGVQAARIDPENAEALHGRRLPW